MPPHSQGPPVTSASMLEDRETIKMNVVDPDPVVSCYTYPFELSLIVTSGQILDGM
jgi:hypothetical protein